VLNGASIVKLPLQLQIRFMRRFWGVKPRLAMLDPVRHYLRAPFTLVGANTKQTNLIGFGGSAHVLQISKSSNLAQIAKPIVAFITIYMVDVFHRPFTSYVSPRKAVRELFSVMNSDSPITGRMPRASNFTDKIRSIFVQNPCKDPCVSVVTKRRSQVFNGAWRVRCHDNALTIGVAA
jgi:hypothetical protein